MWDLDRLIDLDLQFHTRLYEMVGNRVLTNVMESHWTHTRRVMAATLKEAGYPQTAWDEHSAILDAIEAHDVNAAGKRAEGHMSAASIRMSETFALGLERMQTQTAIQSPSERPARRAARASVRRARRA